MASSEVSFDPEWLNKAVNELGQLKQVLEKNPDLSRLTEASTISGDLGEHINSHDSAGGWHWLEQHISDICKFISTVTGDIKTDGAALQSRMQSALDALNGADQDNQSNLTEA